MADFDSSIEDYGNEVQVDSSGDAYLDQSVSSMTVEDLKNYIDYLITRSGILTADEIEAKIQEIARASGMMSVQEIQNLVMITLNNAQALTRDTAEEIINLKVAKAILDLNDNKDFIADVKSQLELEINRVREELYSIRNDFQATEDDLELVKQEFQFNQENVKRSLNLFESLLNSSLENKEVYNLLSIERNTRATQIDEVRTDITGIDSKITETVNNIEKKLNSQKNLFEIQDTNLKNTLDVLKTEFESKIKLIENEVHDASEMLSSLMLSTSDLTSKLQAINSIDMTEDGNVIVAFQDQVDGIQSDINNLTIDLREAVSNLNQTSSKFSDLESNVQNELIANKTLLVSELSNISGRLDMETQDRKSHDNAILNAWADYTTDVNSKIQLMNSEINKLSTQLNEFPRVLDELIQVEQEVRIKSDETLLTKMNVELQKIRDSIDNTTLRTDLELLSQRLSRAIEKYDKAIVQEIKLMFDTINNELVNVKNDINLKQSIQNGNLRTESTLREQGDSNLNKLIELESSIRQTRVQEITDLANKLAQDVNKLQIAVGAGNNTNLQDAVDSLNSRYLTVFNTINDSKDKFTTDIATLTQDVKNLDEIVVTFKETLLDNINSEADARLAGDNGIQVILNKLLTDFNNFIGILDPSKVSLANVYDTIESVRTELDKFKIDFDDDIELKINSINTTLDEIKNTQRAQAKDIQTEIQARETEDLNLDSKIRIVDNKLPDLRAELNAELRVLESNLTDSVSKLTSDLAIETQARESGDISRETDFDAFKSDVDLKLNNFNASLSTEQSDRLNSISDLTNSINREVQERTEAVTNIEIAIANETQARAKGDADLKKLIQAQNATIQSILSSESEIDLENLQAVLDIVKYLNENPDANPTAELLNGLNTIEDNLKSLIENEAQLRTQADGLLDSKIGTLNSKVLEEAQKNIEEFSKVRNELNNSVQDLITKIDDSLTSATDLINTEKQDRLSSEADIISTITAETTRAQDKESELLTTISDEQKARTEADNTISNELSNTQSNVSELYTRMSAQESNYSTLIKGLPDDVKNLKDLLDIINGNYTNITSRIDSAVTDLTDGINSNKNSIQAEVSARLLGDSKLHDALDDFKEEFQSTVTEINSKIDNEATASVNRDNKLQDSITAVENVNTEQAESIEANDLAIANEINNRIDHFNKFLTSNEDYTTENPAALKDVTGFDTVEDLDTAYKNRFGTIEDNINSIDTRVQDNSTAISTNADNISKEIQDRQDADKALDTRITDETSAIKSDLNNTKDRVGSLETEVNEILKDADDTANSFKEIKTIIDNNKSDIETKLGDAKSELQDNIDNNSSRIDSEETSRINGDNNLNSKIDDEITNRQDADDALDTKISDEATARNDADDALQSSINDEVSARKSADDSLQANIDALPKKFIDLHDVADVTDHENYLVQLNSDATGVEFISIEAVQRPIRLDKSLEEEDITETKYVVEDDTETDKIDKVTFGNNYYTIYSYDSNDLLTAIDYYDPDDNNVATKSFTYNDNNRLDTITWENK